MKKLALTALFALTSCASIIEGSSQEVSVYTSPNVAAQCTATSGNKVRTFTTPATVKLKKSYYPAIVTCIADGQTGTTKVLSDVANWGYGGAVLGVGVGAVVDSRTGAAFEYPDEIVVTLGQTTVIGVNSMNSNKDFE